MIKNLVFSIVYIHWSFFFNKYATQIFLHLILFNLVFTQLFGHFNFCII
jgi:hypothetical protein